MSGKCRRISIVYVLFCALLIYGNSVRGVTFECSWQPDSTVSCAFGNSPRVNTKDTTFGVALYACSIMDSDTLPYWWRNLWKESFRPESSVARYFKDMSRGIYHLAITPFGRDTLHRIVSNLPPIDSRGVRDSFIHDILGRADTVVGINFADFDNDGPNHIPASRDTCSSPSCMADGKKGDDDGYVDAVFILDKGMNWTAGSLGMVLGDYITQVTWAHGQRIKISNDKGVSRTGDFGGNYGVIAHEWGHVLGLPDLYGSAAFGDSRNNWRRLGAFSIMAEQLGNNPIPIDPFSQIKLGWANVVEVNTPVYQESIPNFVTSGKVYKIKRSPSEYFLVTNHKGVDPAFDTAGFYEKNFKGYGVVIWHIDSTGCSFDRDHKFIDIELAHGLYDFTGDTLALGPANPRSGKDSLDFLWKPNSTLFPGMGPTHDWQSATCFWNPANNNKINFDGLSNPSSDGYSDSVIDYIRVQNVSTHIGVRNIQSPGQFTTATSDLLVNNWYGHITANTTWGPNKVFAITGDITVDAGKTLTIDSGTTVRLQYNEDNQSSGVNTAKCEIRVANGGKLVVNGTPTAPVKLLSSRSEASASNEDWPGIVVRPGGYLSMNNAVIRHASTGIEDSSILSQLIRNVRIGKCKTYGIRAVNTDSLTIRACRVDSISNQSGYGIYISEPSGIGKGPRLIRDTLWANYAGISIVGSSTSVESCLVQGAPPTWLQSNNGINLSCQAWCSTPFPDPLPLPDTVKIISTDIKGYFSSELLKIGGQGLAVLTSCNLVSDTFRISGVLHWSPFSIRNVNGLSGVNPAYLKLRKSQLQNWDTAGIVVKDNNSLTRSDLGIFPEVGSNAFSTAATGSVWDFISITNSTGLSDSLKAEGNWFGTPVPDTSRFLGPVDYKMSGHISQSFTWSAGNYTIWGDVTVDTTKSWNLTPPTTIYAVQNADAERGGYSSSKTEIIVKGTAQAVGTTSNFIKFVSAATSPGSQDWYGITVEPGGFFSPLYCQFKNAYAAYVDNRQSGSDSMQNCLLEMNALYAIRSKNSNLIIRNDTIKFSDNYGIYLDAANCVISGSIIREALYGINAYRSYPAISNSSIIGNGCGSMCGGSEFGLRTEGSWSGQTQFATFSNSLDSGEFNQAAVIANARLKVLSGSRIKITAPTYALEDPPQDIAILGLGGDADALALVRNSIISYSGYSNTIPLIKATAAPRLDLGRASPDLGNNSILRGSRPYAVANYNTTTDSVYAKNNYWGATPTSGNFIGPVSYSPYLNSAPPRVNAGGDELPPPLPVRFALEQNYPNPFNPATTIQFALPIAEKVKLDIYNILGQKVRTLLDGEKPAGFHQIIWNGTDDNGASVSSGIYLYKIETASFKEVKRMIFLK